MVRLLTGVDGPDTRAVKSALQARRLRLPPPVLTELRSHPAQQDAVSALVEEAALLPITAGFWDRAGSSRRTLLARGLKAKLADVLIAQCCIDADVPLIASDGDFRHFAAHCGLKLAV